jgi:arsenate reductase
MAEGLLRSLYGNEFEVYSAGTTPTEVHPLAIKVLKEINIDISHHKSKDISKFDGIYFKYVISVCDNSWESCPYFSGGKIFVHKNFGDPSNFKGGNEAKIDVFRNTRDSIEEWIIEFFGKLEKDT